MSTQLQTLGSLRVVHDSREIGELPRQKLKCALLLYLAIERSATRQSLMTLLWPDRDEDRARHSLSQALYALRQDLGGDWVDVQGDHIRVSDDLSADVVSFRNAVEQGQYAVAARLYNGPFLKGIHLLSTQGFEAWVDRQRSLLARLNHRARSELVQLHRSAGDRDGALRTTREWVSHDPLDDEAQHLFIELLAESGRRTEALRQFDEYERLLREELDLEPLEHTLALVARVREGAAAPSRAPASSPPEDAPGTRTPQNGTWTEEGLARELAPDVEVVRQLGRGTMAVVFLAREVPLRRLVALKVLRPELARDGTARMRFQREARSVARISHPNVATIYGVGQLAGGAPHITMEYVHGRTLAELLAARGVLGTEEIRRILAEVASGLAAAHERRVVHRDVRPSNVLMEEPSGRAVLTDFGVAAILATGEEREPRLTRTGEILGMPSYMSPEQLAGGSVTEETDVYSLGVMAYQLLTSTPERTDPVEAGRLLAQGVPISRLRPDVDPGLENLVNRCLAERPEHRPTAGEVAVALSRGEPDRARQADRDSMAVSTGLVSRLLERRVPHTAGAALASAWLLYEISSELLANGVVPHSVHTVALVLMPFGFVAATVLAWFHGRPGPQTMPRLEIWILTVLALGWIGVSALVVAGL